RARGGRRTPVIAMLGDTATGALIGAAAALLGSALGLVVYWLGRRIPAEVAAFANQAAGTLDGIRQALAGLELGDVDTTDRVKNVTVYLSQTEFLLGAARLELRQKGEDAADVLIVALRAGEHALRRAVQSPDETS